MKINQLLEMEELTICGKRWKITYCEKMNEVDPAGEEPLMGVAIFRNKEIRVWKTEPDETLHILLHEILHVMGEAFKLPQLQEEHNHDFLDVLGLLLTMFLIENDILEVL
jgi:hypothetical protein